MKLATSLALSLALSAPIAACGGGTDAPAAAPATPAAPAAPAAGSAYAGTREGAEKLLRDLMQPGADPALTRSLQPRPEDYAAVFEGEVARKQEEGYKALWASVPPVAPKEGQTELLLASATSDELRSGAEAAKEFPGGYAQVAPHLKPGLTWYRFKFVKPGEELGMAFDGLVFVNGHWALFPKPWRNLGGG